MTRPQRQRGFTLLEILVATVILAVMGVMAYRGIAEARVAVGNAEGHLERLRAVQRTMQVVATDFRTLSRRPVREPIGDGYRATLLRDPNSASLVELSHAGWPNGAGLPRGTTQRVTYRLEEGKLVREHWNVLDPTLATPPVKRELLDRVRSVEIRYLTSSREWIAEWPQFGNTADLGFFTRPLAVEVTLVLEDYGEIRRLVEVPG
jgi:general secretion pathway protein J